MIKKCIFATAHTQNILFGDTLYNIKRKKYKIVCAEMLFVKVTFDRMVTIFFYGICFFALFAIQLDYYNIQKVYDQR